MKRIIFILAFLASNITLFAQGIHINKNPPNPPAVLNASRFWFNPTNNVLSVFQVGAAGSGVSDSWIPYTERFDKIAGSTAPQYTPNDLDAINVINAVGDLYYWDGSTWLNKSNTDNQTLSNIGNSISITGGNSITLPAETAGQTPSIPIAASATQVGNTALDVQTALSNISFSLKDVESTASNGIVKNGRNFELGQGIAATDIPLSSNRKIAMGGNNVVFTGTGNLGIGTATPTFKIHNTGTSKLDGLIQILAIGTIFNNGGFIDIQGSSLSAGLRFGCSANLPLVYYTNGVEQMRIFNNAVGIGTTNPTFKLDVTSNGRFTQGLTVLNGFTLQNGTQAAGRVLTSDANGLATWQAPTAGTTYTAGTGIGISGNVISNTSINTDNQQLSLSGNNLSISNGNTVILPTATTYTAESGIQITGSSIINNGDISNINELPNHTTGLTAPTAPKIGDVWNDTNPASATKPSILTKTWN